MASSSSSSSPEISNAVHTYSADPFSFKYASQDEVLEDLSSRFILNLPDEELASVERICFQVEQAHWYYEDFIREENPKLQSLPLKKFSAMLFHACPLLKQWSSDHEQAFTTFMQYKTRVPVCGAIMLNDTREKCVLVKGWKSSSGWGFPKGKINQDEEPHHCAIREVAEETGYDLTGKIRPEDCIELNIKEQRITLYIVGGVPEDYPFQTKTRKEISKIEWFKLLDLPTWKRNKPVPGKFYLISPFVPPLKEFLTRRTKQSARRLNITKNPKLMHIQSVQTSFVQDDDEDNFAQSSYVALGRDPDVQGSSSQSSSADVGDPHTPSPQHTQACVVAVKDDADEDIPVAPLDPHFARLLNGLSSSATKVIVPSDPEVYVASSTPVPATVEPSILEVVKQRQVVNKTQIPQRTQGQQSEPPSTSSASAIVGTNSGPSHLPMKSTSLPLPHPPSALHNKPLITGSTPSASALMEIVRRPTSTTDGSPYLNTVTELPISERRRKQLALLESVASESSHTLTLTMNHNGAAVGPYKQGMNGNILLIPPPPSTSVPPQPVGIMGSIVARPQPNMLYSTSSGQAPPPLTIGRQVVPSPNDPFHYRPWTSNAAFPPSARVLPPYVAQIMYQDPTHFTLGNSYNVPPPYLGASSNLTSPFNSSVHPFHGRGPQPLRVMPPHLMNSYDSGPLPAPLSSPSFTSLPNAPRPSNKAHLLSILNTNNSLTAEPPLPNYLSGRPAPNTSSSGVLNGIVHR